MRKDTRGWPRVRSMPPRVLATQRRDIDAVSPTARRRGRAWQNYVLGLACVGAIVAAYELVGPPSTSSSGSEVRLATVARGVVQASESASGNLAPASEIDLNFKSSGILTELYVSAGEHVYAGKLLAEIDPTNASVALQEANANLEAADAKLAETEADPSGASTGSTGGGQASAAVFGGTGASGVTGSSAPAGSTASTGATGASSPKTSPATTKRKTTTSTTTSSTQSPAVTQATEAANLASARAAVASDQLTVQTDQDALDGTKLYAPSAGTIASISGAVGDEVSAGSGSSSNSSAASGSAAAAATGAASTNSSSNSSGSGSSSGSGFIVLADLSQMQMTFRSASPISVRSTSVSRRRSASMRCRTPSSLRR
jgi:macrolide-specific efflux system membrane fusion protein